MNRHELIRRSDQIARELVAPPPDAADPAHYGFVREEELGE